MAQVDVIPPHQRFSEEITEDQSQRMSHAPPQFVPQGITPKLFNFKSYTESRALTVQEREKTVPDKYISKRSVVWLMALLSTISFVLLLIVKTTAILYVINAVFDGDFDHFIFDMRKQPFKLAGIFMIFYLLGSLFLFPISVILMTMAFAFTHIWGIWYGGFFSVFYNYVCINVTFTTCFLLGRYLFGDFIYSRAIQYKVFFALDRAVVQEGAWLLFMLRSSFIVPHAALTYACAVTDMTLKQFIIGNSAWLPVSVIYVYIGSSAAQIQLNYKEGKINWLEILTSSVGLIILGLVVVNIRRKILIIMEQQNAV